MMKYLFEAILLAYFVAALANSSVKTTTKTTETKKAQCNINNYNSFYSGPNCKNIEQHLEKINEGIEALKENKTGGPGENGLSFEDKQQLAEIKQEIRALIENVTRRPKFSQQLAELKQEIRALKENVTGRPKFSQQLAEVTQEIRALIENVTGRPKFSQQLAEVTQEIRALKENLTGGADENGLLYEVKQQLTEIKRAIRTLKENRTIVSCGKVYKNCAELYQSDVKISGVYKINPDGLGEFEVFCDQKTAGGGWTVFQKRYDGSVDFFRGWDDYKRGFGNLSGEFWLGHEKIHRLTVSGSNKLRVDLDHHVNNKPGFAEYSSFAVADETQEYKLSLGNYSGNVGDALAHHDGLPFTTKDRDHDKWTGGNCALLKKGAWWYKSCYHSNLNGQYLPGKIKGVAMIWYGYPNYGELSIKRSEMKIRSKDF